MYYGARYYDPRTSVWQSPDPILDDYLDGYPNGGVLHAPNLNLYAYTYQNPVKYIDPSGLDVYPTTNDPVSADDNESTPDSYTTPAPSSYTRGINIPLVVGGVLVIKYHFPNFDNSFIAKNENTIAMLARIISNQDFLKEVQGIRDNIREAKRRIKRIRNGRSPRKTTPKPKERVRPRTRKKKETINESLKRYRKERDEQDRLFGKKWRENQKRKKENKERPEQREKRKRRDAIDLYMIGEKRRMKKFRKEHPGYRRKK